MEHLVATRLQNNHKASTYLIPYVVSSVSWILSSYSLLPCVNECRKWFTSRHASKSSPNHVEQSCRESLFVEARVGQYANSFRYRYWWKSVHSIYYHIYTMYHSYILSDWNKLFLGTYTYQELVWPWQCAGWYDIVVLSYLVSNVYFNCIVQDSLYHNMDIGTMWHCAFIGCTPS